MKHLPFALFIFVVFSIQAQKRTTTIDFESSSCTKLEEKLYFNSLLRNNAVAKTYVDSITGCMTKSKALNKTLGKYYYQSSDYVNAKKEFSEILKDATATKYELGETHYYLALIEYYTDKPDACMQQAREALSYNYKPSWANNLIGLALFDKEDYPESVKYHELALKIDPNNYLALNNAGVSNDRMGNGTKALRYFQMADSSANGKSALYKSNITRTLLSLERKQEANESAKLAQEAFPESHFVISDYANSLTRQEKYFEALVYARKLLAMKPSSATTWFEVAHVFDNAGIKDSAFLYYNVALRYDPKMGNALHNLGIIYRTFGKFDQAEAKIDAALALDSSAKRFQSKVSLYIWKKDIETALIWSRRYHGKYPNIKGTNLNLGYVLMESKKYEEAIPYLKHVLDFDPKDDRAMNNLGRCYAQLKQVDTAFAYFTRALAINPGNSYTYHNRAALYCDLQQYDLACADLATAIEKEYNWNIDENLETMKRTHCPAINTNRKVLINEYKGNIKELGRFNFIELSDAQLDNAITTQLKIIDQDSLYKVLPEKTTNASFDNYKVYPNPSSGEFYLEGPNDGSTPLVVNIIDEKGTVIFTDAIKGSVKKIELKNLPNGIYVLTVKSEEALLTAKKLVIEK